MVKSSPFFRVFRTLMRTIQRGECVCVGGGGGARDTPIQVSNLKKDPYPG